MYDESLRNILDKINRKGYISGHNLGHVESVPFNRVCKKCGCGFKTFSRSRSICYFCSELVRMSEREKMMYDL